MDPIEKIIREAQERGDFDNLPGAGKPIDLSENPWVSPDWQMAYRLLASSGYAPDVVEEDKAIRVLVRDLEQRLDRFARHWQSLSTAERREQSVSREKFLAEYLDEIRSINNRIHSYNATAPRAMNRGTLLPDTLLRTAESRLPED
jgi:DnaJ homolog subfamily C member 28